MTNTYSTGNPLGSVDPRDSADNKSNFDEFANSSEAGYTDRLGVSRLTQTGVIQRYATFNLRGEWVTATAYNTNDVWRDGASGPYYRVPADYTSGATAAIDIAAGNAFLHQDTDKIIPVANVTALRALTGIQVGQSFYLEGHTVDLFGAGPLKATKLHTSEVDNNGTLFVVAGVVIERELNGYVTPDMFGALRTLATDSIAWNSAIAYAAANDLVASNEGGTYLIETTGTKTLSFTGVVHNVCILVENPVIIDLKGCILSPTISNTEIKNAIYVDNTNNVEILDSDIRPINTVVTRIIYRYTSIVITESNSIRVIRPKTVNSLGNCLAFNSSNVRIETGQAINATNISGMHFGLLGCDDSRISKCTTYNGTNDGDIGVFGSGENNIVESCNLYNFAITSTTRIPVFTGAQGIFVDSGMDHCSVSSNYLEGYFYGIDVKTNVNATRVTDNTLVSNKVSIAVRLGEGNDATLNTLVNGNTIIPNQGNGNTTPIFDTYTEIGIFVQNANAGVLIGNNNFGGDHTSAGTPSAYVGIYLVWSSSLSSAFQGNYKIANNQFMFENRIAARSIKNIGPAIVARGVITNDMRQLAITGNSYDLPLGNTGDNIDIIDVRYCTGLTISSDNIFSDYRNGKLIKVHDCHNAKINNNSFDLHYGILDVANTIGISFSGNNMLKGLAGVNVPTLLSVGTTYLKINDNQYTASAGPTDGEFLTGTTSDYLTMTSNQLNIINKNASNFYSFDGLNINVANNQVI